MVGHHGRLLALGMTMVVVTACAAGPSSASGPVRDEDRESGFLLTISTPHLAWGANQPISVSAELSYLGPGTINVSGPGPGPHVKFAVVELTGDREMQGAWLMACQHWTMTRGHLAVPFAKSGGWSAEDPDAAFYEAYIDDPEFRLPPGRWEVSAIAPFSIGECTGQSVYLKASVTLTVQ
jgi:hypothetical protein